LLYGGPAGQRPDRRTALHGPRSTALLYGGPAGQRPDRRTALHGPRSTALLYGGRAGQRTDRRTALHGPRSTALLYGGRGGQRSDRRTNSHGRRRSVDAGRWRRVAARYRQHIQLLLLFWTHATRDEKLDEISFLSTEIFTDNFVESFMKVSLSWRKIRCQSDAFILKISTDIYSKYWAMLNFR